MVTTTIDGTRTQAAQCDAKVQRLKDDIIEREAELNLITIKERKASGSELPQLFRTKEILVSHIASDKAQLSELTEQSASLWGRVRADEESARRQARIAEPELLRREVLSAVSDFKSTLATMAPKSQIITAALKRLRQITDSAPMNSFPIPAHALAAQAALRECHEQLRELQATFEKSAGIR